MARKREKFDGIQDQSLALAFALLPPSTFYRNSIFHFIPDESITFSYPEFATVTGEGNTVAKKFYQKNQELMNVPPVHFRM